MYSPLLNPIGDEVSLHHMAHLDAGDIEKHERIERTILSGRDSAGGEATSGNTTLPCVTLGRQGSQS